MNLTRALNVALPDIPAREILHRVPRIEPGVTFREHVEDGERIVRVYFPSTGLMYRLSWGQWNLARLFDGKRSYAAIAELYSRETGQSYDEQAVYEFASDLQSAGFWYRTEQEKNVLLLLQSKEERKKQLKAKNPFSDLSMITFPAFNPDGFLNWLYPRTRFLYTRWFTVLTLLAFAFSLAITLSHWSEIGRDTVEFYNFTDKTAADIAVLYVLGIFVVAVHEFAHAHACKHAGGRVPAMGFALIFLTPAFYTDTTEGAVMGDRSERLVISLAGIWAELMVCSIATPVWWLTAPDTMVHEGAYFMMMLTGIVSLIVNWNPLMKLDGYYMLCEIIGIAELKEDATAYLSAWVKRRVWRLPVEIPYVPRRRRPFYAAYALLSGAYSYLVLTVVARFAGNVSRNFSPEWAFLPEYGIALLVFKSRIRLLVNFMKLVYLDKKDRVRAWFASRPVLLAAVLLLLCLLPLWHQSTSGRFVLEPVGRSIVRAAVPGVVAEIFVEEGSVVAAGEPIAQLRNLPLESEAARARARLEMASSRAISAELRHQNYGAALHERERLLVESRELALQAEDLLLRSPRSGVVLTPHLRDRAGSYLREGSEVAEVADLAALRARIYVSEYDMYKVRQGAPAKLHVDGTVGKWASRAAAVTPLAAESDPSLIDPTKFKGLRPPRFYAVDLPLSDPGGGLKPGMTGTARVYGERRSLLGFAIEGLRVVLGRKIW